MAADLKVSIAIEELPARDELARLWQRLAAESEHSFFLSWPWIDTWLTSVADAHPVKLLVARAGGETVGAALVTRRQQRRRGLLRASVWIFQATGDPLLDNICIESNGILARRGYREAVWRAVVRQWLMRDPLVDELGLEGFDECSVAEARAAGAFVHERLAVIGRYRDLQQVRSSQQGPWQCVSASSRKQLRRKLRAFESTFGPVAVAAAADVSQALSWLGVLGQLSTVRWQNSHSHSAFSEPFFVQFHRRLVSDYYASGTIQLLHVTAGQETLAYLYNFTYEGVVYAYQSGVNYDHALHAESPGLLAHFLSLSYNLEQGMSRYEMLGRDCEYKRTLCPQETRKWWGQVQRPRLALRFERLGLAAARHLGG